ncbi:MAG TPA: hypothetical protein VF647_18410 [Longimicrobium sp.]
MPEVLLTRGVQCRDRVCTRLQAQQNGSAPPGKLHFDQGVYGNPTVKSTLVGAQHQKCCYCESIIGSAGDIEHFRPKGGVQQSASEPVEAPGYYWLAFEWTNLLLSCKPCHQLYKKNLFPLRNPQRRARKPSDPLSREKLLLIDPAAMEPEDYISFRREVPYAVRGNRIGKSTLEVLQLHNRTDLNDRRRTHLESVIQMRVVVDLAKLNPKNLRLRKAARRAEAFLVRALSDAGEFSAMTKAARAAGLF